mmetsp:Transcript_48134/g.133734  ORF Transcript_48134/g.133734 Transcript_48134/m.133734 type:complete len:250 (+) Transcript_48134:1485-2234(+)
MTSLTEGGAAWDWAAGLAAAGVHLVVLPVGRSISVMLPPPAAPSPSSSAVPLPVGARSTAAASVAPPDPPAPAARSPGAAAGPAAGHARCSRITASTTSDRSRVPRRWMHSKDSDPCLSKCCTPMRFERTSPHASRAICPSSSPPSVGVVTLFSVVRGVIVSCSPSSLPASLWFIGVASSTAAGEGALCWSKAIDWSTEVSAGSVGRASCSSVQHSARRVSCSLAGELGLVAAATGEDLPRASRKLASM